MATNEAPSIGSATNTDRPAYHRTRHGTSTTPKILVGDPVYLNAARRRAVAEAVNDTCARRNWHLHAQNIRTNHFHAVVSAGTAAASSVLHALKANATRQLRQSGCWEFPYSPWVDRGSKRFLWKEQSIADATEYVINGQGDELPDFLYPCRP